MTRLRHKTGQSIAMDGFDADAWVAATRLFVQAGRFGEDSTQYRDALREVMADYDVALVLKALSVLALSMCADLVELEPLFQRLENGAVELMAAWVVAHAVAGVTP